MDSGLLDVSTAAQLLYELMTEQAHKQYDRSDNGFSDVPAGQWYTVAVSTLANVGAITGYSNGTFQPGKAITRAEFVTILAGIYGENTSKGMPFSDVGHTYKSWPASSAGRRSPGPKKQQTPGTSVPGVFSPLYRRPCMKPSMAVAWMSPPMTRLR